MSYRCVTDTIVNNVQHDHFMLIAMHLVTCHIHVAKINYQRVGRLSM